MICIFNVSNGEKIWNMDYDYGISERAQPIPIAVANGKLFVNSASSIYVYG